MTSLIKFLKRIVLPTHPYFYFLKKQKKVRTTKPEAFKSKQDPDPMIWAPTIFTNWTILLT